MSETNPLPYQPADGIKNGVSENAMLIHHDKLYAGYVAKKDEICDKLAQLREKIIKGEASGGNATYSELRSLKDAETFATNGVYLHEWYFDALGGDGVTDKAPELSKTVSAKWGSVENFMKYLSECAMATRGWSLLAWDTKEGELKIYNADAHNQGGVWGCLPIIVLDIYEHAYFMDYGSDRKKYIEDFWKNFSWGVAEELYKKVSQMKL